MPNNQDQNQGQNQDQNHGRGQTEFIQGIVNTALEQANNYQSKNSNSGLNVRNINMRLTDVVLIILFVIATASGFITNYHKINSYIDSSKPKIEKLDQQVKTLQEFKLRTTVKLEECIERLDALEIRTKTTRKLSLDSSDQVQNIYSNVNNLMNQIEKLENNIERMEHENN